MNFKIDTKEKFTVITPDPMCLSDNLAAELSTVCTRFLDEPVKNIVLKFNQIQEIQEEAARQITEIQQKFYDNNASFVICEINPELEKQLENWELLDLLNITPTESEAWDIVQMEEIERELLDDDNPLFNDHHEEDKP
jgi:anti-anti-sigma regulatory factor